MAVPPRVIKQIAYIVEDLDAAIGHWVEVVGAGPFFRIDGARAADVRYRGTPIDGDVSLALGNSGGVQIELIAPHGHGPTVYRELPHGVHHLAMFAKDFDADSARLSDLGHRAAFELTLPGVCRVRYHDTLGVFGHFLELWESTDTMQALVTMIEESARDWDGRDPIRRLGP